MVGHDICDDWDLFQAHLGRIGRREKAQASGELRQRECLDGRARRRRDIAEPFVSHGEAGDDLFFVSHSHGGPVHVAFRHPSSLIQKKRHPSSSSILVCFERER